MNNPHVARDTAQYIAQQPGVDSTSYEQHSNGNYSVTVEYDYDIPEDTQLYWHVFEGYDTTQLGTPEQPMYYNGIAGPVAEEKPNNIVLDGMNYVKTFDHEPTQEEMFEIIPDEYITDEEREKYLS